LDPLSSVSMTKPTETSTHPTDALTADLLPGIAPVFRVDMQTAQAHLIGTGFWLTGTGHLITARHVIEENIGTDGVDLGPIFAVQTFADRSIEVRNFVKSDKHPHFDLALSETSAAGPPIDGPTHTLPLTLEEPGIGEPVFSFAVLSADQSFAGEERPGRTSAVFEGEMWMEKVGVVRIRFAVRRNAGQVTDIFHKMRDRVMLPFPCMQTDVMIYGGNSGGPLLDRRGRICGVHCSSYDGAPIAFHVPVRGILSLRMRRKGPMLRPSRLRIATAGVLAGKGLIKFDPPALSLNYPFRSGARWIAHLVMCGLKRKPVGNLHILWESSIPFNARTKRDVNDVTQAPWVD